MRIDIPQTSQSNVIMNCHAATCHNIGRACYVIDLKLTLICLLHAPYLFNSFVYKATQLSNSWVYTTRNHLVL